MYSREHALVSAVVGALAGVALPVPFAWWVAVPAAVVVGVGIDVDHFLIARVTTGEWEAVRRCLADPRLVVLDQASIFAPDDLWPLQRLLSHHVIGGVAVGGLWLVSQPVAVFTAIVLYAHVLSDLVWDVARMDLYHERAASALEDGDSSA